MYQVVQDSKKYIVLSSLVTYTRHLLRFLLPEENSVTPAWVKFQVKKHHSKVRVYARNSKQWQLNWTLKGIDQRFFLLTTNFPDFTSVFKTFFRSGKLLGKFQEFKTLYEPWKEPRCKGNLPVLAASDMMATSFVPFIKLFLCDTMQSKTQRLLFNYTQTTL